MTVVVVPLLFMLARKSHLMAVLIQMHIINKAHSAVVTRHLKSGAELEGMFTVYSAIHFQSQTCGYFQVISVRPQMVCPSSGLERLDRHPGQCALCYVIFRVNHQVTNRQMQADCVTYRCVEYTKFNLVGGLDQRKRWQVQKSPINGP